MVQQQNKQILVPDLGDQIPTEALMYGARVEPLPPLKKRPVPAIFNAGVSSALTWSEATRFAKNVGLPKSLTNLFLQKVRKWIENSGPEWTCARVKELKRAFMQWYADGSIGYPNPAWFKTSKYGQAKDPLVRELADYACGEQKFIQVVKLLNFSSAMVSPLPTKQQVSKFLDAINTEQTKPITIDLQAPLNRAAVLAKQNGWIPRTFPEGEDLLSSKPLKDSHDERILTEWVNDVTYGVVKKLLAGEKDAGGNWITPPSSWFTKMLSENNLWAYLDFDDEDIPYDPTYHYDTVGTIGVSQEPGYKLRCYASPRIWIQVLLEPLKKFLMQALMACPWDMTHHQRYADRIITTALRQGQTVYCYDLSNATDLIPFESQKELLKRIVPENKHHYIEMLEWVSRERWYFSPKGEKVAWRRGQALGTGPSFGSFALWHGLLLWSLNGYRHDNEFFIVGDDVIILNDDLATAYEKALSDFDLKWSPGKTLKSNRIAEFTGVLFTANGAFKNPKWRKFTSDNFLDNLRNLGPAWMNFVPKQERQFIELVAMLPEPLGFGWNPKGLSLEERLHEYMYLMIPDKEQPLPSLSPASRIQKRISSASGKPAGYVFKRMISSRYHTLRLDAQDRDAFYKTFHDLSCVLPGGQAPLTVFGSYNDLRLTWEDIMGPIVAYAEKAQLGYTGNHYRKVVSSRLKDKSMNKDYGQTQKVKKKLSGLVTAAQP